MFQIWADKKTHPGRKRRNNQDYVDSHEVMDDADLQKSGRLFVLADGVGGASNGEKASEYATRKVLYEYYLEPDMPPEERLERIMRKAGNEIFQFSRESSKAIRMATTMVVAVVRGDQLTVAHVGDSRAYLIRGGGIKRLTTDHSFVAEMIRDGYMTEEEARQSKRRNRITRSLGGEQDVRVDVSHYQLQAGDKILLCSDGFSQYPESDQVIAQMVQDGEPDEITQRLIDYANSKGGSDNISTILIQVMADTHEAPTIRRRELKRPTPLEEMDTSPGIDDEKRRGRAGVPLRGIGPWIYVIGVFSLILIVLIGVLLSMWPRTSSESTGPVSDQVTQVGLPAVGLGEPTALTEPNAPTLPPSVAPSPTAALTNTLMTTNEATVEVSALPEGTPSADPPTPTKNLFEREGIVSPTPVSTLSQDQIPEDDYDCEYELIQSDLNSYPSSDYQQVDLKRLIIFKFQREDMDTNNYFKNVYVAQIRCAENVSYCNYITGSQVALVGQQLVFPFINSAACRDGGGWIIYQPNENN